LAEQGESFAITVMRAPEYSYEGRRTLTVPLVGAK
jgi:hypothetical protein